MVCTQQWQDFEQSALKESFKYFKENNKVYPQNMYLIGREIFLLEI